MNTDSSNTRSPSAPPRNRRPSLGVKTGEIVIGGGRPVVIQSMAITDTCDTRGVVDEIEGLIRAGCPLIRLTVPHLAAAENLPAIRAEMRLRRLDVPLIADIHFTPSAALVAAESVEKVRVNPGNYVDRKRFAVREYTDPEYAEELARIRERFLPLVRKLKERKIALRIGTNHGSLSDRIMNRYGDTPEGMVESALEFVRICEAEGFHDIVLSMKSSIPSVMVAANRLLAARMDQEGMQYPIHIGVTEAGAGLDGRVKSAIGIGALLLDGIGDTIRVSLTEDSIHEIPACRLILSAVERQGGGSPGGSTPGVTGAGGRRETRAGMIGGLPIGGKAPPRVEVRLDRTPWDPGGVDAALAEAGERLRPRDPRAPQAVAEIVNVKVPRGARAEALAAFREAMRERHPAVPVIIECDLTAPGEIHALEPLLAWADGLDVRVPPVAGSGRERIAILARLAARRGKMVRFRLESEGPAEPVADQATTLARICADQGLGAVGFVLSGRGIVHAGRAIARALDAEPGTRGATLFIDLPVDPMEAAVAAGSLLIDGIGDGLAVPGRAAAPLPGPGGTTPWDPVTLAYTILQACRLRLTRADFIACPSCGRTQFDLQSTTRRIQEKTAHLAGVKIAIMGCIVNGPGEMADADFGYVGSAPGRVDLYVGRTRVRQSIPEEEAERRLCELIREHGMWRDP